MNPAVNCDFMPARLINEHSLVRIKCQADAGNKKRCRNFMPVQQCHNALQTNTPILKVRKDVIEFPPVRSSTVSSSASNDRRTATRAPPGQDSGCRLRPLPTRSIIARASSTDISTACALSCPATAVQDQSDNRKNDMHLADARSIVPVSFVSSASWSGLHLLVQMLQCVA